MLRMRRAARKLRLGILCLAVTSLIVSGCGSETTLSPTPEANNPRAATLSDLAGNVSGRATRADPLAPLNLGFQLNTGGQVQTGDESRARLDFTDQSILRLASNSSYSLDAVEPQTDGSVVARLQLTFGKLWVSVTGGVVEVETPVGVASVRGSFAVFQYAPGDPNDPTDDLLLIDCLEGTCTARNPNVNEQLGNLERLVLNSQSSLRQTLTQNDVLRFLLDNPESNRMVATLTAAPPATATKTSVPPTATRTATAPLPTETASLAPAATDTLTPTIVIPVTGATLTPTPIPPTPAFRLLGIHAVQSRETLFCIGRGYGVLPAAIALANNRTLNSALALGERLSIPAIQWDAIPNGPVCPPQFNSPFPGLPAATATNTATPTPTLVPSGTPTSPPVLPTSTLIPTLTFTPLPTATFTPLPTATFTPDPNTTFSGFGSTLNFPPACTASFTVTIADLNGLAGAHVTFTRFYSDTTPWSSPETAMLTGPTTGGLWSGVSSPYSIYLPLDGYIDWSVVATDTLSNVAASPVQTIPYDTRTAGCG